MVPEGWKKGTLKDSLEEIHQGLNTAAEKLKYSDEGWPILQTKHIVSGVIDASGARKVSDPDFELYRGKYQPEKNSILFSNIGTIGKSCLVKEDFEGLVAWNILYIKPKSDACVEFLVYFLQRHDEKGYFSSLVAGNAAKFINKTSMEGLQILYPPLPEQKKIAQILSTWDQAITATERLLESSQQRKKGLMQQLLTGKKRLPGFEGEWEKTTLGAIGRISSAGVDKKIVEGEKSARLLNYLDVFRREFIFDHELTHEVTAPERKIANCDVRKGDVFFTPSSETREEVGIPAVAVEDMPGVVYSYHVVRFRPSRPLDLSFAAYAFQTDEFRSQTYRLCDGSGQRYVLSQDDFRSIQITVPDLAEQKAIGLVLKAASDEILALSDRINCLKQEKKALMQQLLTGKRRVQVEAA